MKKVILFAALTTMLAGTIVSCGKSTKGKMDGDWKVDSYKETSTYTNGSGTSTSTTTIEGTSITNSNTSGGTTTTSTGTVDVATWNIKKDGTWERELSFTFVGSGVTTKTTAKSSGNWDFQGGVGEFKKNERVVFSTLSETSTQIVTIGGLSTTDTDTETYLDGESTEIYVITESKKKELAMEAKKSNTSSSSGSSSDTNTTDTSVKLTLE